VERASLARPTLRVCITERWLWRTSCARPPDFTPSSETPGGYVGQAVLEGFGFNEVLKCHSKTDFWVVGKCCEEGAFEDEDDDEDEDDLAAGAAMGLAQKSARMSKSPRADSSFRR
jgi:hypothetical protein